VILVSGGVEMVAGNSGEMWRSVVVMWWWNSDRMIVKGIVCCVVDMRKVE
jgi:hypothetical protein